MHGLMHFLLVAGATIGSIQLALLAMGALNIEVQPGFGLDDIIEGILVALGVSLTLAIARPLLKSV